MDIAAALERIHDHIENDRVENAVMACLRVARASKDFLFAAIFLRELYPSKAEIARALFNETQHLNDEAKKFIYERSLDRHLDLHTIESMDQDSDKAEGDRANVLPVAAGEIESEIKRWQDTLADLVPPPGLSQFDVAEFTLSAMEQKGIVRTRLAGLYTVKARLKTRCFNYALEIERQFDAGRQQDNFLHSVQAEVHNYFRGRSDYVVQKLIKASQLAASKDGEDCALVLTEVRRAMKAAADLFWPVTGEEPVKCSDGQERKLGDQQYLNRLQEFARVKLRNSSARDLLLAELDHLDVFFRRLNDLASKGVHAEVTVAEARQGLVGLYFFLSNLIRHLVSAEPQTA
ncbi:MULTISPECIES: hypothetical protein [Bradyrhizobium]|uniref:hypothetical protein n=1 Tax=Bradyrhizobium TaxID=374 RepID=UPI000231C369|nr:hypothetical protein [Bradyrhizobium japonicum]AJA60649.1 hypothetical protein RN69_09740 [Bradyrhizobium japonicum]KMJ99858.1 hypothetical protein CF64_04125 [Bradyrhizobium japonicum]MCS3534445.1 hypothetical protein [Bradyrhizobium japonicum]MCS3989459.1 hypothetical protein [Bradyrhizobium japonicum]MCS4015725.1 hypothetical protein [Bradyrhizobium japonicum]